MKASSAAALKRSDFDPGDRWFELIVEASPYAMIVVDGSQKIVHANRGAETVFGYGGKELAGLDIDVLVPARYRASHAGQVSGFFRRPRSRAISMAGDLFGRRKDGSEVPIEIGLNPIETVRGRFILASILDMTERRRHEEALRLAVEAAPNAMLMADSQARIALINGGAEHLFGYARDELIGQPVEILTSERFRALDPRIMAKFLGKPKARQIGVGRDLFVRRKDGTEVLVEIGINSIETPRGRFTLASIVDITERHRHEQELRRSQREALDGKQRAEDRALLLRRLWDEIAALAIRCGLPGADAASGLMLSACEHPSLREGSLGAVLATFETAFRGYMEANSKLAAQNQALAAAKAVTEASNRELEAFSYSVAHDLRSPLRTVDGFCQILEEDYSAQLDETARDYLGRVRRAALHMATLIDDLLRLARITQGDLSRSTVNLSSIAAQIRDSLCEGSPERTADFTIPPDIIAVGDSRLLRVVLENLLSNAWKFTSTQPSAHIEFGSEKAGGQDAIFVRDNGVGFDMAYSGKLFGAFQRLHNVREFPGTGIGLATVQRIIIKHGGRIWAESEPGKGATFRFVL